MQVEAVRKRKARGRYLDVFVHDKALWLQSREMMVFVLERSPGPRVLSSSTGRPD